MQRSAKFRNDSAESSKDPKSELKVRPRNNGSGFNNYMVVHRCLPYSDLVIFKWYLICILVQATNPVIDSDSAAVE